MGVVNIFLGGSGKYIAEELKGIAAFQGIPMPPFLAFDVDTSATHTGTFTLDQGAGELQGAPPGFPMYAHDTLAVNWMGLDPSRCLSPLPNQAGPELRPEAAILRRVGETVHGLPIPDAGLWGVRGSGLLAFSSFFDQNNPLENAGQERQNFERNLQLALTAAAQEGQRVWVNLVASTAGGTGAGTFLPFALWLRQFNHNPGLNFNLSVALVLLWWTTFRREPAVGVNQNELFDKGESGSYAILRELQLLNSDGGDKAEPAERVLPLWQGGGGLGYQFNRRPFNRVYLMGLRQNDTTGRKEDTYQEASRLIQVLSNSAAATAINAATGQLAEGCVAAVTTVDYPRLRVSQRITGDIATAALDDLIGRDTDGASRDALSQLGSDSNTLESFFRNEKDNALSRVSKGAINASFENMDSLVDGVTPGWNLRDAVVVGNAKEQGAYSLPNDKWRSYCVGLRDFLWGENGEGGLTRERQQVAVEASSTLAFTTHQHFRDWLAETVIRPKLNPGGVNTSPNSVQFVLNTVTLIASDVDSVKTFFSAPGGVKDRVPATEELKYQAVIDIRAEIGRQWDRVITPPAGTKGLRFWGWLAVVVGLLGVSALTWNLIAPILADFSQMIVSVAAGVAFAALLFLLLRQPKSLEERRGAQEQKQLENYQALIYRQTADALFASVAQNVAATASGLRTDDQTFSRLAKSDVARATELLEKLTVVYTKLRAFAALRIANATRKPLHCVKELGTEIQLQPLPRRDAVSRLRCLVKANPEYGATGLQMWLQVGGDGMVASYSADVEKLAVYAKAEPAKELAEAAPGQQEFEKADKTLDDSAASVIGIVLPTTFAGALEQDGAKTLPQQVARVRDFLGLLVNRDAGGQQAGQQDRRMPSVDMLTAVPTYRALLVPDDITESFVQIAKDQLPIGTIAELGPYYQNGVQVVKEMGPSIVALTVYRAGDLFRLPSVTAPGDAFDRYYGLNLGNEYSQRKRNFHCLPELAASASIETSDNLIVPICPIVIRRLLGSDITTSGPTLLELFYLLRQESALAIALDGAVGPKQVRKSTLSLSGHAPIVLHQESPIYIPGNDPFGPCRPVINMFDAFTDFMLYDGGLVPRVSRLANTGKVMWESWAALGDVLVGNLQREVVLWWYKEASNLAAQCMAMKVLAGQDAGQMVQANGAPLPAAADWLRVVTRLVDAGCQKRRQLHPGASPDAPDA